MKILLHKKFEKKFLKLHPKIQKKVGETIVIFKENPFEPSLKNHPLKGQMIKRRAISVTGNYRIVFEKIDDYKRVVLTDVGTHPQVY